MYLYVIDFSAYFRRRFGGVSLECLDKRRTTMPDLDADLFNLAMSDKAQPLMDAVKKHIAENVEPITERSGRAHV